MALFLEDFNFTDGNWTRVMCVHVCSNLAQCHSWNGHVFNKNQIYLCVTWSTAIFYCVLSITDGPSICITWKIAIFWRFFLSKMAIGHLWCAYMCSNLEKCHRWNWHMFHGIKIFLDSTSMECKHTRLYHLLKVHALQKHRKIMSNTVLAWGVPLVWCVCDVLVMCLHVYWNIKYT